MSKDFYNPTRIRLNQDFQGTVTSNDGDQWFDIVFNQACKAVFEVRPSSNLDVNFSAWNGDEMTAIEVKNSNGHGIPEKIEINVNNGQRIKLDVQHQSGSGSFTLSCKMKSGGSVTPNAKEIKDNDYNPPVNISKGQEHWYYVRFNKDGKANFFVEPLNSQLDVDITVYKGSTSGEVVGQSAKPAGQWDLVEKKPVIAGIIYYIKIKGYDGSGQYKVRCKNYTTDDKYSHLLKKTACYEGNGGSKNLPTYEDETLTKQIGSISNGEIVTVKSIINEVALITYSTSNGTKDAYIPLSHLDGKEYIELYIKQMKARYTPKILNGWYTYDGWIVNQEFNDLTSRDKYLGHLGIDIKNIIKPVARAVYPGKVHYAGISYSRGRRSANGYVVQIEHTYGEKTFYSFYAHLRPDSINVKKDDQIEAGEIIGIMGHTTSVNTGNGMGDHIHLGIYTGTASPQGAEYGYNRVLNSEGKQTFYAPKGYYTYKDDTFYKPNLWHKILKLV
ncbi:M23 family metallopeptidase [Vallitalea sp.]|jgi:murein DD-endopeptidase MepM/ murein hydrolase activator NlpD|uniref:M23 family metallopeptidase n=1 Tax=Vallitalea sp. TaxID=1882829 RepID=UPI0025E42ED4|nr:M23 family metallopeptidase [Vallitalea sp.]MCT4686857.1 M23 family metallopeptidase [Vallitalea sp.]